MVDGVKSEPASVQYSNNEMPNEEKKQNYELLNW